MLRDEETYFLRQMQECNAADFAKYFSLTEKRTNDDGALELHYAVTYGTDEGYLTITYLPENGELLAAEMDVGFPTMLGLNRSPLELRILAEHVIALQAAADEDQ